MKRLICILVGIVIAVSETLTVASPASANDSPNWLANKPNSFTIQASGDLSTRGTVSIKGLIPPKDPQFDEAIRRQQTNGGTGIGFCTWTIKDAAYPGYLDPGGVGILILGPQLTKEQYNTESYSMRGIYYEGYLSQSPSNYSDMYIYSTIGSKGAINLNGSDLLLSSTEFKFPPGLSFYFLKEFTASFSTNNWPAGTYQILGVYNDGCSNVYTSSPLTMNLNSIPTPNWKCATSASIKSDGYASINCTSDTDVSLLPYHLEAFQGGNWVDINHGTANGRAVSISKVQLPVGLNSLRFRTDTLANQYYESTSAEFNVQVQPAPYSTKCSIPTAVRVGEYFDVACLASSNIDGAVAHLQSLSNNKWITISDGQWSGNSLTFSNMSYSKTGSGTLRVTTDSQPGKYLSSLSASTVVRISAAAGSSNSGGGVSSGSGAPSGKVDKTSNAYKTMVNVGRNFARVSTASDSAQSQCSSAARSGMIKANGIPQYLGLQARMIQSYLQTASGFQGCLDGFGH